MNTTKSSSKEISKSTNGHSNDSEKKTGNDKKMQSSQLMKLFETELKDIYWAEKALTKAIPNMIKNATSEEQI